MCETKAQIYERWEVFIASKWNTVIGYKYISFWTLPSWSLSKQSTKEAEAVFHPHVLDSLS